MSESYVNGIPLPTSPADYSITKTYYDGEDRYEVSAKRHGNAWDVGVNRMQDGKVVKRKSGIGWVWKGSETAEEACEEGWRRYRGG